MALSAMWIEIKKTVQAGSDLLFACTVVYYQSSMARRKKSGSRPPVIGKRFHTLFYKRFFLMTSLMLFSALSFPTIEISLL